MYRSPVRFLLAVLCGRLLHGVFSDARQFSIQTGAPLDDKDGPRPIVIPGAKPMDCWVRQVTTLKIANVE